VPQPQDICTFRGFAFFQTSQQTPGGVPSLFAYPPTDFAGLGGSVLVTLEQGQRIALVQFIAGNYVTSIFDNPPGFNVLEGNSFVDCDVPTPTPTPTATFTPTPTATSTPTATFTPQRRLPLPLRQHLRLRLRQPRHSLHAMLSPRARLRIRFLATVRGRTFPLTRAQ
jgi:hypothetical protein